jgi:hypothetical protein
VTNLAMLYGVLLSLSQARDAQTRLSKVTWWILAAICAAVLAIPDPAKGE